MAENNRLDVMVEDGKYRLIMSVDGRLRALRYGEEWRDLCGDGLILALGQRIEELEADRDQARARLVGLEAALQQEHSDAVDMARVQNEMYDHQTKAFEVVSAERDQLRKQVEAMTILEQLRADEGNCVTFVCDNPDFNGQPNCAIEVCAEWTAWAPRRFSADTVLDCLRLAAASALEQKEQG